MSKYWLCSLVIVLYNLKHCPNCSLYCRSWIRGGNLSTPRQFQFGGSHAAISCSNPWLATDIAKNKIEITSLLDQKSLPINTVDIVGQTLLCGTDGETIFTMNLGSLR